MRSPSWWPVGHCIGNCVLKKREKFGKFHWRTNVHRCSARLFHIFSLGSLCDRCEGSQPEWFLWKTASVFENQNANNARGTHLGTHRLLANFASNLPEPLAIFHSSAHLRMTSSNHHRCLQRQPFSQQEAKKQMVGRRNRRWGNSFWSPTVLCIVRSRFIWFKSWKERLQPRRSNCRKQGF